MKTGTRNECFPAFDEDGLWQESTKGGLWDELLGTLVLVALVAAGAALILAG